MKLDDEATGPAMRASERPLKAFVSSVMSNDMNDARRAVVATLDDVPFLASWAFEFTPASSEAADDTYLRHVRDADFVIWLAGTETTAPVENEIREALLNKRALIIIRVGPGDRSSRTDALLTEVGNRAKYADAADIGELGFVLGLTIGDEIVRALRSRPDMSQTARIQELGQASLGRSLRRWQATGLSRDTAYRLASDPHRGAATDALLPSDEAPVVLLCGPMGSGKSQIAERYLQSGLARFIDDSRRPIPVWTTALSAERGLQAVASEAATGLGQPARQGVVLVVDGLDEVGISVATRLLGEARELSAAWPSSTVLLTSRPLPALQEVVEARHVPPLTDDAIAEVASLSAGKPISALLVGTWDDPVRETVRRPLFALLYGLAIRGETSEARRSKGDLLALLGAHARMQAGPAAEALLRKLAVASVRRELGPVPATEVGDYEQIDALVETGIVVSGANQTISLGLPAIAQWFAAQAIIKGEVDVGDLVSVPSELDLWRYPMAIVVATASFERASQVLEPLMASVPGLGFWVIDEALVAADGLDVQPPAWERCASEMHSALTAIAAGLGALASEVLPVTDDGRIQPLGVDVRGRQLVFSFSGSAAAEHGPTFQLGTHVEGLSPGDPLPVSLSTGLAWPWLWARDVTRDGVSALFASYALPYERAGVIGRELAWRVVTESVGAPGIVPIPLDASRAIRMLEKSLEGPVHERRQVQLGGFSLDAQSTLALVRDSCEADTTLVPPPHPGADLQPTPRTSSLPQLFSDQGMVKHLRSVYAEALVAYQSLADGLFSSLGSRLSLKALLPAAYVGFLDPDTPVVSGHFWPLERPAANQIRFEIDRNRKLPAFEALAEDLDALRPEARGWLTVGFRSSMVNLSWAMPSTELAYDWIWDDLVRTRLVIGSRPNGEPVM